MTTRYLTDAAGKGMKVVDVGGYIVPVGLPGSTPEQVKQKFEYVREFKCRNDDVMLLSYQKTGTNWLNQVILMLLNKSTEPVVSKLYTFLEFQTQDKVDSVSSPRCLNTHLNFNVHEDFFPAEVNHVARAVRRGLHDLTSREEILMYTVKKLYLPKELKEKQIRTVLVVRNPKDTLVSYYNHVKGLRLYEYSGEWKDWFQLYLKGEMEYGMYWDYLKEFEKAIADGIGFPLHILHYEDLKMNGLEEVKKLAKFFGVDADEEFCQKVVDKCSFEAMEKQQTIPDDVKKAILKDGFNFFRKGQVGDWMNWFTVAENQQFDKCWDKEMADSTLKFTYAQSTTK